MKMPLFCCCRLVWVQHSLTLSEFTAISALYCLPVLLSCIFKRLWSKVIDSKKRIPPAYVASRAGMITLFLFGF
jgi:hypothetical protein